MLTGDPYKVDIKVPNRIISAIDSHYNTTGILKRSNRTMYALNYMLDLFLGPEKNEYVNIPSKKMYDVLEEVIQLKLCNIEIDTRLHNYLIILSRVFESGKISSTIRFLIVLYSLVGAGGSELRDHVFGFQLEICPPDLEKHLVLGFSETFKDYGITFNKRKFKRVIEQLIEIRSELEQKRVEEIAKDKRRKAEYKRLRKIRRTSINGSPSQKMLLEALRRYHGFSDYAPTVTYIVHIFTQVILGHEIKDEIDKLAFKLPDSFGSKADERLQVKVSHMHSDLLIIAGKKLGSAGKAEVLKELLLIYSLLNPPEENGLKMGFNKRFIMGVNAIISIKEDVAAITEGHIPVRRRRNITNTQSGLKIQIRERKKRKKKKELSDYDRLLLKIEDSRNKW